MIGAIIGDIAGSKYEFDNVRTEDFELMGPGCDFTDDTICTVAIADAILNGKEYDAALQEWCRKYPHPMGGYGTRFNSWIWSETPEPYKSYGNGCAMRVSPVGWLFDEKKIVAHEACNTAAVTHNHPASLYGAEHIAVTIYRLRGGAPKEIAIKDVENAFGWLPEYRPFSNPFDETVMNAVPVAVSCFMASNSFEDAIRKSIIVGGDSDTIGAITGSIAEAYYGVPEDLKAKTLSFLPEEMKKIYEIFDARRSTVKTCQNGPVTLQ